MGQSNPPIAVPDAAAGEMYAVVEDPNPPLASTASSSRTKTFANSEGDHGSVPAKDGAMSTLATPTSGHEAPAMRQAAAAAFVAIPAAGRHPSLSPALATAGGPDDQDTPLRLELLLLSGARLRLSCRPEELVGDVKRRIWKDWPAEWVDDEPAPDTAAKLGLLFRGRFLPDDWTLEGVQLDSNLLQKEHRLMIGAQPLLQLPGCDIRTAPTVLWSTFTYTVCSPCKTSQETPLLEQPAHVAVLPLA
ncbi:hypothetical protein JCM3774_002924 [Rhodotorula dairenensis]